MRVEGPSTATIVYFVTFPFMPLVLAVDVTTCRIAASCGMTNGGGERTRFGLAAHPCGYFYTVSDTVGPSVVLSSGQVVRCLSVFTGWQPLGCSFDPVNGRLHVLTTTSVESHSIDDWHTYWKTAHGLTFTFGDPSSIDCDRSGNTAIAAKGQVKIYDPAGTLQHSQAFSGATCCAFDASGNLLVGGTVATALFTPTLGTAIWSNVGSQSVSVGDTAMWVQASPNTLKLNPATGNLLATVPNVRVPCAYPGGGAIGLAVGSTSGTTLCQISPSGTVTALGDRVDRIAFTGIGTSQYLPLNAPGSGKIGAFAW